LDEFDVFMDAVNRRISLNSIISYAREDRKNQFVFLTPLNTSNITVGEDVKIIKLSKLPTD
jgi:chromosome segregation ATPase